MKIVFNYFPLSGWIFIHYHHLAVWFHVILLLSYLTMRTEDVTRHINLVQAFDHFYYLRRNKECYCSNFIILSKPSLTSLCSPHYLLWKGIQVPPPRLSHYFKWIATTQNHWVLSQLKVYRDTKILHYEAIMGGHIGHDYTRKYRTH